MENDIAEIEVQPTGIGAFGWGLLGFFGSNLIMNLVCAVGVWLILPLMDFNEMWGLLALPLYALAVWFAWQFKITRRYQATATGVSVSIVLGSILFVLQCTAEL